MFTHTHTGSLETPTLHQRDCLCKELLLIVHCWPSSPLFSIARSSSLASAHIAPSLPPCRLYLSFKPLRECVTFASYKMCGLLTCLNNKLNIVLYRHFSKHVSIYSGPFLYFKIFFPCLIFMQIFGLSFWSYAVYKMNLFFSSMDLSKCILYMCVCVLYI